MSTKRNLGFDVARAVSMFYIIGILHLSDYTDFFIAQNKAFVSLTWSTLGIFTFLSSFLLASKYAFDSGGSIKKFYLKRIVRFYPLFFISSLFLLLIHFTTFDETWKGLLGISPFWKPQQHTLWYIATLIFLYEITPLLSKDNIRLITRCGVFIVILIPILIIQKLFHSVDPRLFYYIIVYFTGILCAKHFRNIFNFIINSKRTLFLLVIYVPFLILLLTNENCSRPLMMGVGYFGIVALLNCFIVISNVFSNNTFFNRIITFISYGSMCAYLFHREIYWLALKAWKPQDDWVTIAYLFCVILPIILYSSYYIQKGYDKICSKFI